MNRISIAMLLAFALAAGPALAGEGEEHVYDREGRYEGRSTPDAANPEQRNLYDAKGKYVGRIMTSPDGSSRVYDQHGKYLGRASGGQLPKSKQ
jgi:hypothetical protein